MLARMRVCSYARPALASGFLRSTSGIRVHPWPLNPTGTTTYSNSSRATKNKSRLNLKSPKSCASPTRSCKVCARVLSYNSSKPGEVGYVVISACVRHSLCARSLLLSQFVVSQFVVPAGHVHGAPCSCSWLHRHDLRPNQLLTCCVFVQP